jgi:prephenate dehydrogenase
MDICSIKEYPSTLCTIPADALTLGTHPVFGPGSKGVKHKAYVLTPTNEQEAAYAEEFKAWLEKEEAHVFVMSPQKHDELMSLILGMSHFIGLVACETLLEQHKLSRIQKTRRDHLPHVIHLAEVAALETPISMQTSKQKFPT